ncbi:11964_t:CDS:2 [Entrophospora sp. SA101]|nr:11964_t:CDS:2 [Entrophospora sp. SA101]
MSYYFAIVGTKDNPIYELELGGASSMVKSLSIEGIKKDLSDFLIEYLKSIDKFNEWHISSMISAGNIKFMLLHETKNEDGIRNFFNEAYELYIKILMNPFYEVNSTITSVPFDTKVKFIAKKFL